MSNKISINPSRQIITSKQIKKHFSDKDNITWVKVDDLTTGEPEQCVDGRSQDGIIGTPGGNMGEFILMLDAAEKVAKETIRSAEVFHILSQYIKHFGAFYMHTDTHALQNMLSVIKKDKQFSDLKIKTISDIEELIRKPSKEHQPALLEYLIQSSSVGCGHIKLMLNYPNEYGVRTKLITTAIRAYFRELWGGTPLDYVVLDHEHEESAVVVVMVEDKMIDKNTMIPTVASMGKNHQIFIIHPQAVSYLRKEIATDIVEHELIEGIGEDEKEIFLETINNRGNDLARFTLSHLAMGLPHYTVVLGRD